MQQRPDAPPPLISPTIFAWLRKPQFMLPIAVVAGMIVIAFGVQPGGAKGESDGLSLSTSGTQVAASPSPSVSATATKMASSTAAATSTVAAAQTTSPAGANSNSSATATANSTNGNPAGISGDTEVAGARETASPTATPEQIDMSHQSTQCGSIQESSTALSVEQVINGVSVKATRAASYPIEYFRCILMATGSQDSFSLAGAVSKAQTSGMTHAILIDLWVTNAGQSFAQLNLRDALIAAAGDTFAPIATLGGRAEVVISSGQGRSVTMVVGMKTSLPTPGPVTLTITAPLFGGQPTAGKYQLFLPTP